MTKSIDSVGHIPQDGFPARLRQAIAAYGSATALAQAIQRSEGAVRKWARGISEPNVSDLRAICELTGVSIDWLVTGRGESRIETHGVREALGVYEAQAPSTMDYSLLETILSTVDSELRSHGVEIAPTKRSTLVVTLYRLFRDTRSIDRDAVVRLVKLAA